jgi:hypothetical protein
MSRFDALEDAVLSVIAAANPLVTVRKGLRPVDEIPPDRYPFAFTYDTQETTELLTDLGERSTVVVTFAYVDKGTANDLPAFNEILDAIRLGVRADPTLGGAATVAFLSSRFRDERPPEKRLAAILQVTATVEE